MADIVLIETPESPIEATDTTKTQPTTATLLVNPVISSIDRVSNNIAFLQNLNIANLDSPPTGNRPAAPSILTGRRPTFGQLFPRGYFNR